MPRGAFPVTGLDHITDEQSFGRAFDDLSWSLRWGPVNIELSLDASDPALMVGVRLLGVNLGTAVLNPSKSSATIGGSAAGIKAEVTVTADFENENAEIEAEACLPFLGCQTYRESLSW